MNLRHFSVINVVQNSQELQRKSSNQEICKVSCSAIGGISMKNRKE